MALEFKRETYGNADADKKELLKDISAFANTLGGDLFIGIEEKNGVASALTPLSGIDIDTEILRLSSILRDGIEPTLIGMQIRRIRIADEAGKGESAEGAEDGAGRERDAGEESGEAGAEEDEVIHIRVPRSFTPPHRVIFQGLNRFFGRDSVSAHQLSMPDLRRLFGQERDMYDRARAFIGERFLRIQAGDTPVPVKQTGSGLVMHLVPLMDFAQGRRMDIGRLKAQRDRLDPISERGGRLFVNLDGVCVTRSGGESLGYTQIFRDGSVEAFQADIVVEPDERCFVPSLAFANDVRTAVGSYLKSMRALGASAPVAVTFRFFGMKGARIAVKSRMGSEFSKPLQIKELSLPDAPLDSLEDDASLDGLLQEQFDILWNAFGYDRCSLFDADGAWNPPR